jgi:hypothetical protein
VVLATELMVLDAVLMVLAAELIMVLAAVLMVSALVVELVGVKLQTDFETVKGLLVINTVVLARDRCPTRESSPTTLPTAG